MATETANERRQVNLSLDKEAEDEVSRLLPIVSKALGVKVTRSSLFRLGLSALAREYSKSKRARS